MRVGVYNRYLATLGGGEQYSLAIAEELSTQHTVEVISHTPVARRQIEERLGLDLAGVGLRVLPERPAAQLGPLSAEYDLFINASNLDFILPQNPRSALLVYFPVPAGPGARLRRRIGGMIRRWGGLPEWQAGAFGVETRQGQPVRGLAPVAVATLPTAHSPYTLAFGLANARREPCEVVAEVDGLRHAAWRLPARRGDALHFTGCRVVLTAIGRPRRLALRVVQPALPDANSLALYVTLLQPGHGRYRLYRQIFEQRLAALGLRLEHPLPDDLAEIVAQYRLIWSISRFTQSWVQRYWGQASQLLYPPVAVERFTPGEKRPQIVSVGRFFAGSHNKRHDVLLRAFRQMVDAGLAGWELHLAGGTTPGAAHAEYLAGLRRLAEGYPMMIHPDLAGERLVQLYGASTVYWHAAGYGESERRAPEKLEHFGITTVEAMAAGCVPVVIGRGGQTELVTPGQDGYLWYTIPELIRQTQALIANPAQTAALAAAAQEKSRQFDRAHFRARLWETLGELL
jgi:glycosyltransferase involved in cell wall biosynthesis